MTSQYAGRSAPSEIEVELDRWVATVPAGELEGIVIQPVNADLTPRILRLVPEIRDHDACPFTAAEGRGDGPDDLNLPRAVVEGLSDSVVAPLPLVFGLVEEDGVEFVEFQIASDIGEPGHRNDVPVRGLDDAALSKPLLAGVGRNEGSALRIGQGGWDVSVPFVATVGGIDGVFAADVEDLTLDGGGEVVLTAIATVGGIKDRPGCIGGGVGLQVDGDKTCSSTSWAGACQCVRRIPKWGATTSCSPTTELPSPKQPARTMERGHGTTEEEALHDGASLRRDLKASLACGFAVYLHRHLRPSSRRQVEQMRFKSRIRVAAHPRERFSVDEVRPEAGGHRCVPLHQRLCSAFLTD